MDDDVRMAVGARVLGVEVERREGERRRREDAVVARAERPSPVMLEDLARVEVLERVPLRDEREIPEVGIGHGATQ